MESRRSPGLSETTTGLLDAIYKADCHTERDNCQKCGLVSKNRKGTERKRCPNTCMSDSTLSCTMVGGLVLGEMILTNTPSMKSLLATWTWNLWPQFFTHVSNTCRERERGLNRDRSLVNETGEKERLSVTGSWETFWTFALLSSQNVSVWMLSSHRGAFN